MLPVKVAVIYYSSTGTNYALAQTAAEAAREMGAEVRVRKVRELAPESAISSNPQWKAHYTATKDVPEATLDDLDWADVYIFSTPTRYGVMASQMKQFLDSTGPLWAKGKLANKVATVMTSASNGHGGQEATILSLWTVLAHWGAIIVPPGYTDQAVFAAGGNPYGTSVTVPQDTPGSPDEKALAAARYQAKRVITVAAWILKGQR
ncbi:MAG: NAD(P)H:quinone oxidoreductase [Limnochordaceae bacterium]|nr:NAD(P)H:quinone oxidoreductase [Limnochordaceae bacterium]